MNFKVKALAACLVLLGLSSNAFAVVCTSTTSWGSLGPPGSRDFGNSFSSSGSYADCYTFSLSASANAFGGLVETDPWLNRLDIDITSVALFNGGVSSGHTTGSIFAVDSSTPLSIAFNSLSIGTYSLVVYTTVIRDLGLFSDPVSYRGNISTARAGGGSVPIPEPRMLALLGLGLALIGLSLRRRLARVSR